LIGREADTRAAIEVKALQASGDLDGARERFAELVSRHQRRALRIAFHYVRDSADADEAVQDAFVKAYTHIGTFRDELPFEVWFTRILINGCLDRLKARKRREKWLVPPSVDPSGVERNRRTAALSGPEP
jgi:RNA polymerase sigma-70 factor (ECF subfamily)